MASHPSDPRIRCPRCGYDLRAVPPQWTDRCPVEGTCTECGLVFEWADLFSPTRRAPRWFVESDGPLLSFPVRAAATLFMCPRPWRFWRELRMTHPPRWGRFAVYALMVAALLYVVFAVGHARMAGRAYDIFLRQGATSSTSRERVMLHAALLPFSTTSAGTWTMGWTAPARAAGTTPRGLLSFYRDGLVRRGLELASGIAIAALVPFGFVVLPASRRLARVRWSHLGRIALHGGWLIAVLLAVMHRDLLEWALKLRSWGSSNEDATRYIDATIHVVLPLALVAWWGFATSRYLRMRHPWGIAVAVVLMAWLAELLVSMVLLEWWDTW